MLSLTTDTPAYDYAAIVHIRECNTIIKRMDVKPFVLLWDADEPGDLNLLDGL